MSISIRLAQSDRLTVGVPACLAQSGTRTGIAIIVLRYSNPPSCAPFAPSQLRDFIAITGALTPVARLFGTLVHELRLFPQQVSLINASVLPDHSVSKHLMHRCCRFITLPFSSTAFLCGSRLRLWLAGSSNRTRPNRVCHPTDWSFTSCCSPPHIAVSQLHSVTGRRAYAWRGLSPLRPLALSGALANAFSVTRFFGRIMNSRLFVQSHLEAECR